MVITFVAAFDPACRNQVWCDIINDLTPHTAYNVIYKTTYLDYGQSAIAPDDPRLDSIISATDLFVCCPGIDNGWFGPSHGGYAELPPCIHDGPFLPIRGTTWANLGKPIKIWLWGSNNIRAHFSDFHKTFDRWPVFSSDEDIAQDGGFAPGLRPCYFPWAKRGQWDFSVAHSTSDPRVKNTAELVEICKRLSVPLRLIQHKSFRESLAIKCASAISFDHLQGYTGAASWEAAALGIPNIVNVKPQYGDTILKAWQADSLPPWLLCETIQDAEIEIKRLKENPSEVDAIGKASAEWFSKHFRPREWASRFFGLSETKGLVSILMPARNAAPFIGDAIESVIRQTYENWQLIIVDDNSEDGTFAKASEYAAKDKRIVLLRSKESLGYPKAMNACFAKATGDYIARLDADDMWSPDKLEKQTDYLDANPGDSLVTTDWKWIVEKDGKATFFDAPSVAPLEPDKYMAGTLTHYPPIASIMARRAVWDSVGEFDPKWKGASDAHWNFRAFASGCKIGHVPIRAYWWRRHPQSMSEIFKEEQCRLWSLLVKGGINADPG